MGGIPEVGRQRRVGGCPLGQVAYVRRRRRDQTRIEWDAAIFVHARPWGTLALVAHPTSVPTVLSSQSHQGRLSRALAVDGPFALSSFAPRSQGEEGETPFARGRWRTVFCWSWANRRAYTRRVSNRR